VLDVGLNDDAFFPFLNKLIVFCEPAMMMMLTTMMMIYDDAAR